MSQARCCSRNFSKKKNVCISAFLSISIIFIKQKHVFGTAGQMGVGDGSVFHCLASLASLEPQGSEEIRGSSGWDLPTYRHLPSNYGNGAGAIMGTSIPVLFEKWISKQELLAKSLMPRQLQQLSCFPQQCSVDGGRVVHILGETWTDGIKITMLCKHWNVLWLANASTQSSTIFHPIHPLLLFHDFWHSYLWGCPFQGEVPGQRSHRVSLRKSHHGRYRRGWRHRGWNLPVPWTIPSEHADHRRSLGQWL